jgi:NTP pyrophosphatase (non-canonical NTP hydrolase)
MHIKQFQKDVNKIKKKLDWDQYHQPKDLLLGMVEEIGEMRNLIKWEQDQIIIKKILLGKNINQFRIKTDLKMTYQQRRQLYLIAATNGKYDDNINKDATKWLIKKARVNSIEKIGYIQAEKLINTLIREDVEDFFQDMLWFLGSFANYCRVDLDKAMTIIIRKHKKRFPPSKVKGTTATLLSGGYDGKYLNKK